MNELEKKFLTVYSEKVVGKKRSLIGLVRFSLKYLRVWKRLATIIFFEICRYVSRKFI